MNRKLAATMSTTESRDGAATNGASADSTATPNAGAKARRVVL